VSNMVYFEVRNFQEFQHYSKRNPPWIRLYYRLLHDREFFRLAETLHRDLRGRRSRT
jgi:hypothetical protein